MKDLVFCGVLVALGFGAAHFRASTDPRLKRVELLATVGSFAAAGASALLVAYPAWWPVGLGSAILFLLWPFVVGLATWATGEAVLRWSRHPVLGLLGAFAGMLVALYATGRFDPGRASAKLLFLPLMAGAFGGYQVACGGRRPVAVRE